MSSFVITDVPPYDGRYEFSSSGIRTLEWGWIRRISGHTMATFEEGLNAVDAELLTALALIAVYRAGKIEEREVLDVYQRVFAKTVFGENIEFELDEEEDAETADDVGDPSASSNGSEPSSSEGSPTSSATSANHQSPTGIPGLVSSVSAPTTSES